MSPIPSRKIIDAALGYLALGLAEEAWHELDEMPPEERALPEVIRVRIEIYRAMLRWEAAADLARGMTVHNPQVLDWWLLWADSLRRAGAFSEACHVLRQAEWLNPCEPELLYEMARCGHLAGMREASRWMAHAIELRPSLRQNALADAELAGLKLDYD